ncbi:NUDIX hydrolase [Demequina silvatica]|uniref:NUDIX hydrolase n=1 Tax=Demequina silvatica TaxID=1638988 RepID=UPI000782D92C|nr:NUDIX domain-containing protein [Demequina silvatica]
MAIPEFILDLRSKIGTDLLWLPAATAVVLRPSPDREGSRQVLLVKRADNGWWTPVTGIVDPGEEPATAAVRECLEEADVVAEVEALMWVHALPEMEYANGDRAQYLDLTFRCRYVSGEPFPADGENTEAAWFELDELPEMPAEMAARIDACLVDGDVCRWFS